MPNLDRIAEMERALDRAAAVAETLDKALTAWEKAQGDFAALSAYMDSGEWLKDYLADEEGLIPRDMKRGVLSQDALYDLLTEQVRLNSRMKELSGSRIRPVIHIFGASGSGTTTLGRALSKALGLRHMDTDDYFWLPTNPKYTAKRPVEERLTLMQSDIDASGNGVVISGSLTGWGNPLMPRFTLAIRVVTPTEVRLERLKAREYARFGERIRPAGDMHEQHREFLDWAAQYDTGDVNMRSKAMHDRWQEGLSCPLLIVDGTEEPELLVERVRAAMK